MWFAGNPDADPAVAAKRKARLRQGASRPYVRLLCNHNPYLCPVLKNRLFNWFFYGHVLIALAAAGLGWLSIQLVYNNQEWVSEWPIISFLFSATLGIYTLHRYLSFQRAGIRPTTVRYNIVDRHPRLSLFIGTGSLFLAVIIGFPFLEHMWTTLLWATPLTVFYLTPPIKGWRRLRDLPYVKVIWVAWAWTLMTHTLPVQVLHPQIDEAFQASGMNMLYNPSYPNPYSTTLTITRFLFTGSIAILFDFRDVILDRSQGVKTIANTAPRLARIIVTASMVICVFLFPFPGGLINSLPQYLIPLAYLAVILFAWLTHPGRSEHWYAVMINGLLLGPVVMLGLAAWLG